MSYKKVLPIFAWGWVATVWSTILSCRDNPAFNFDYAFQFDPTNALSVRQYGGFPLQVFAFPMPPLGPGPHQSWVPLAINFVIWTLVVLLIARLIGKRSEPGLAFAMTAATVAVTVASTAIWIFYMLLAFD